MALTRSQISRRYYLRHTDKCRAARKEYYTTHVPEELARNRKRYAAKPEIDLVRTKMRRQRNSSFVWDWKSTHPCVDCGEGDPVVLDFDHRDPNTKKYGLGKIKSSSLSLDTVVAEIAKCDVRCSNCHRRRTHNQRMEAADAIRNI